MNLKFKSQSYISLSNSQKRKEQLQKDLMIPNPLSKKHNLLGDLSCNVLKELSAHQYLTPQMINNIKMPNNIHYSKRLSSFQKQLSLMQDAVKKQQQKCEVYVEPIKQRGCLKSQDINDLMMFGSQRPQHLNINAFLYNKRQNNDQIGQNYFVEAQQKKLKSNKHVGFAGESMIQEEGYEMQNRNFSKTGQNKNYSGKSVDMFSDNYQNINCNGTFYSQCHIRFDIIDEQETDFDSEIGGLSKFNSISDLPIHSSHMINCDELPINSRHNISYDMDQQIIMGQ